MVEIGKKPAPGDHESSSKIYLQDVPCKMSLCQMNIWYPTKILWMNGLKNIYQREGITTLRIYQYWISHNAVL